MENAKGVISFAASKKWRSRWAKRDATAYWNVRVWEEISRAM
jgi:hypothetical protein